MALVYSNPYERSHIAAKQELEQRLKEVEMIQQRIVWLRATIAALDPLVSASSAPPQYGTLADLCCAVLSANPGRRMTVSDVRRVIDAMGIKLKKSTNPAAIVNVTLRRLSAKAYSAVKIEFGSEVDPSGGKPIYHGPTQFYWDTSVPRPSPQIPFANEM